MKISLANVHFQRALPILKKLVEHHFEAYFVGGCVRDSLLGQVIHDVDIASSALPDEVEEIFPATIDLGKEHGTVIVLHEGEPYEVTTFRKEEDYVDNRRPSEVHFISSLKEDTLRRDFTINAMALDTEGVVYDYHQGIEDLKTQLIRAVGQPLERFEEDALRMIRAIRFAAQLNFQIEEETMHAMQQLAYLMEAISIERIRIELTKYFTSPYYSLHSELLQQSGLAEYIPLAPIQDIEGLSEHLKKNLAPYMAEGKRPSDELIWALIVKYLNITQVRSYLKKWTFSNEFIHAVESILEIQSHLQEDGLTNELVYFYPLTLIEEVIEWFALQDIHIEGKPRELYDKLTIKSRKEMKINGQDIIKHLELDRGGPIVGRLLQLVEQALINKELSNQRSEIIEFIEQNR